jgi:hypothetical protein
MSFPPTRNGREDHRESKRSLRAALTQELCSRHALEAPTTSIAGSQSTSTVGWTQFSETRPRSRSSS